LYNLYKAYSLFYFLHGFSRRAFNIYKSVRQYCSIVHSTSSRSMNKSIHFADVCGPEVRRR